MRPKTDMGNSVNLGHPGGRNNTRKRLSSKHNPTTKKNRVANIMSRNTKMDGENGDGEILPINAKMTPDLPLLVERKEYLALPPWLVNDYKSTVADLEGWQCVEIARTDCSGRKDKYYTHRDYAHTFRSKKEVQHFLDTGEVKGKGLLQKKSADDPGGQSSGSRRSTKRTMLLPANNDPPKRPTAYADFLRRPNIGGMFRYLPKEEWPPGFL